MNIPFHFFFISPKTTSMSLNVFSPGGEAEEEEVRRNPLRKVTAKNKDEAEFWFPSNVE